MVRASLPKGLRWNGDPVAQAVIAERPRPAAWAIELARFTRRCESPIEEELLLGLMRAFVNRNGGSMRPGVSPGTTWSVAGDCLRLWAAPDDGIDVVLQKRIGPYRVDFLMRDALRRDAGGLVVEADGRAWHESREAMTNDRRRDRWFLLRGLRCVRFMGHEINNDAVGCGDEVLNLLSSECSRRTSTPVVE